jgi:hypothetical protein
MGRKKSTRTKEEWAEYHADRQRKYYAKNREKLSARKKELYHQHKAESE